MKTLVVAPHPDDEVLGVGGTVLRRKHEGASTAWLIITGMSERYGWQKKRIQKREEEIAKSLAILKFDQIFNLNLPTTRLDEIPLADIIQGISKVINEYKPNEIFLPHYGDVHSDHTVVFNSVVSCSKSFRYPFINRILTYETLSETDFGLIPSNHFNPNVFIDITNFIEEKLKAIEIYDSEMGDFPFPRSLKALESLAKIRGATAGFEAAEAFQLLRERI